MYISAVSPSALPNIFINLSGMVWNSIKAKVLTTTPNPKTVFKVFFTLSNFPAP